MYDTDQNLQLKELFGSQADEPSTHKTTMLDQIVANKGSVVALHLTVRGGSRSKAERHRLIVGVDV